MSHDLDRLASTGAETLCNEKLDGLSCMRQAHHAGGHIFAPSGTSPEALGSALSFAMFGKDYTAPQQSPAQEQGAVTVTTIDKEELGSLKRDAERYRYLRSEAFISRSLPGTRLKGYRASFPYLAASPTNTDLKFQDNVDSAVDRAIESAAQREAERQAELEKRQNNPVPELSSVG